MAVKRESGPLRERNGECKGRVIGCMEGLKGKGGDIRRKKRGKTEE